MLQPSTTAAIYRYFVFKIWKEKDSDVMRLFAFNNYLNLFESGFIVIRNLCEIFHIFFSFSYKRNNYLENCADSNKVQMISFHLRNCPFPFLSKTFGWSLNLDCYRNLNHLGTWNKQCVYVFVLRIVRLLLHARMISRKQHMDSGRRCSIEGFFSTSTVNLSNNRCDIFEPSWY